MCDNVEQMIMLRMRLTSVSAQWLIVYCAKTGSPPKKHLIVKNFKKKCNPPHFKFYPSVTMKFAWIMVKYGLLLMWFHLLTSIHVVEAKIVLCNGRGLAKRFGLY